MLLARPTKKQSTVHFLAIGTSSPSFCYSSAPGRTRPTAFRIAACSSAKLTNSHARPTPLQSGLSAKVEDFRPQLKTSPTRLQ
jgi:hypothetical protein